MSDDSVLEDVEAAAQIRKAVQWLEEKWPKNFKCPIDQSDDWSVGQVFQVNVFSKGVVWPARVSPVFPVTCMTCGYTIYVNAIVAGIVGGESA